MRRFAIVHLEYGQGDRNASLAWLQSFRDELERRGDEVSLLIVDNKREQGSDVASGFGWTDVPVIAGDNSNREFTGWDAGIRAVLSGDGEPDVWVFTNDTVATHHGWSQTRLRRFASEAVFMAPYEGPWLLGELTDVAEPDMTPIGPIVQWMPTYAFIMNAKLRQALRSISPDQATLDAVLEIEYEPRHKIFREGVEPGSFLTGQMAFLIAEGSMEAYAELAKKMGWKSLSPFTRTLTAESFPNLSRKMRCIVSECFLSARAVQAGAVLRGYYEGQQGRRRLSSTIDFIKDKVVEKIIFRRFRREKKRKARRQARSDAGQALH